MTQPNSDPIATYDLETAEEAMVRLEEDHPGVLEALGAHGVCFMRETEDSPANCGMAIWIQDKAINDNEEEKAARVEAIRSALDEEGFLDMPIDVRFIGRISFLGHSEAPEA